MYNNIYDTVNNITVYVGESVRINCPSCKGYKTFTVSNIGGNIVWNCYKASCAVSGGKRIGMTPDDIKNMKAKQIQKEIEFELPKFIVKRSNLYMNRWCARWGLDVNKLGLHYDVKEDRVVFPVVHDNKIVDATGRALTKRLPKWRRYGSSSLPYTSGQGDVAVVVEDCVSAAVVGGEKFVGVALLGTTLLEEHKQYLTQFSATIVALDPDVLPKTIAMATELRSHIPKVKVLRLEKDLKYGNPTDIEKLKQLGAT
jgi:hypothetical protein